VGAAAMTAAASDARASFLSIMSGRHSCKLL
jgi:hypothetical protein